MLSVIESEAVLDAAREMNRRDVLRIEVENGIREKDDVDTELLEVDDNTIWGRTEGVDGTRGASGERLRIAGCEYSYGPYPRNRRVLADIALIAGWDVETARGFERRCVQRVARHFASGYAKSQRDELLNPVQPMHNGKPFTFQHISWSFLREFIESELEETDPTKMAAVKAAVLDLYENNSITGKKVLPIYGKETRRISDDVPVSEADIERAQETLDKKARYRVAVEMSRHDKKYMPPDQVKRRIKAFVVTHQMPEEDFCKAIDVTEDELTSFMKERKLRPQQESKVFHNAQAFMNNKKIDKGPPKKRVKTIAI